MPYSYYSGKASIWGFFGGKGGDLSFSKSQSLKAEGVQILGSKSITKQKKKNHYSGFKESLKINSQENIKSTYH